MSDKEFCLEYWPRAVCHGPHKIYWPGQGERTKYIVLSAPIMSRHEGEGDTEELAWANAAARLRDRRS